MPELYRSILFQIGSLVRLADLTGELHYKAECSRSLIPKDLQERVISIKLEGEQIVSLGEPDKYVLAVLSSVNRIYYSQRKPLKQINKMGFLVHLNPDLVSIVTREEHLLLREARKINPSAWNQYMSS